MKRLLFFVLLAVGSTAAQGPQAPALLDNVGISQKLGSTVPLDLEFRDEDGKIVRLGQYFQGKKPVILTLVYYQCPMLCTEILNGLIRALRVIPLSAGKDFQIVTVSFDPKEGPELASRKRLAYLDKYRRKGAENGWAFLTGTESSIRALTEAAGFRYAWDAQIQQFAHGSAIMVLTPEGRLARYFYGVEYPAQDLRLTLVEASDNHIGTLVEQVMLYCYRYDPASGRYGLVIMNVLRAAAVLSVLILGAVVGTFLWHERRTKLKKGNA